MSTRPVGLHLYLKERQDHPVFKDLLQLLKTQHPGKATSFAYVEAQTSLIPHLSLWENIQLVAGHKTWKEFEAGLNVECSSLANLIREPMKRAGTAEPWENFCVSLLKALICSGSHLLIDMNEAILSPLMVQNFKKILAHASTERSIYLASAHSALWLDCAHSMVHRKEFEFIVECLDQERVTRHWAS